MKKKGLLICFLLLAVAGSAAYAQEKVVFSGMGDGSVSLQRVAYTVGGVSFNMIEMPGGSFMMGATDNFISESDENEKPAHRVSVRSFAIGETEVSQELWVAVMGDNPSLYQNSRNLPVESVSYNDCIKFISKLNSMTGKRFRLPTEAEWEYAARGGNLNENVYCGAKYPGVCLKHNKYSPLSIKSYSNDWRIYDMSGNVREWCSDWMGRYTGSSGSSQKVCRGGGWGDPEWKCRSTSREGYAPDYVSGDLGFRLAMDTGGESLIVGLPEVEKTIIPGDHKGSVLQLTAIEYLLNGTVFHLTVSGENKEYKMIELPHASSLMYVKDLETGTQYKIRDAKGMTYGGGKYFANYRAGDPQSFTLIIDPLPKNVRIVDWVAGKWGIEGIKLTQDAPKIKRAAPSPSSEKTENKTVQNDDAIPYSQIDNKPTFQGGSANKFSTWVSQHLVYPEQCKINRIAGRVMVRFTIATDGTVKNVEVLRSSGDQRLDAEALRVVKSSPKWTPGNHDGKPVNVTLNFPVIFALN